MKTIYQKISYLLLVFYSITVNAQLNLEDKVVIKKIDSYLTKGVANGFSGAILVAKGEDIILSRGYGMANKEKGIPNGKSIIYDIGSVTKQFTAAAILKLTELDKLKVSDPLSTFFKDLPSDKKNISIHQLLTHSAGLIDNIGDGDFDHIPTEDYFKKLFASKLINTPGTKHAYSNSGYSLLARIIELVSGQDYETFLETNLFNPSGMVQTGYLKPEWDSNLYAMGYKENVINIGSMAARYRKEGKVSWALIGNGGINSTIEDMYKWDIALKTNKVLSKASTDILTKPYILEYEGGNSHYGYGWAIFNTARNTKRITHNGGNGVFFHDFIWLPEEEVSIIYFTSAFTQQIMDIAWDIEKMLFDASYIPKPIWEDLSTSLLKYTLDYKGNLEDLPLEMEKTFKNKIKYAWYLNDLGYYFINEDQLDKAIAIFELNVLLFPEEANNWDSLGESYYRKGDKIKALEKYKKALFLNQEMQSAQEMIKILEEEKQNNDNN